MIQLIFFPPSVTSGGIAGDALPLSVTTDDDEVDMIRVGCGVVSVAASDTLDEGSTVVL